MQLFKLNAIIIKINLKDVTMQTKFDEQQIDINKAIMSIVANSLINSYAEENIVLKRIQNNEIVPIYDYLQDLNISDLNNIISDNDIDGLFIEAGRVKYSDFKTLCFEFYESKIEFMFNDAFKHLYTNDNKSQYYKDLLHEYSKNTFEIFYDIVNTEPKCFQSFKFDEQMFKSSRQTEIYVNKFLTSIVLNKLQLGKRVDKYVKKITDLSKYLTKLVHKENEHYVLVNNDPHSIDFILALFSSLYFCTTQNKILFKTKIEAWEKKLI